MHVLICSLSKFYSFLLIFQMPKPAPAESSCVPTASAWPPSTCATVMTTVEMAAMSSSVPPLWPVDPTISAATPQSVYRSCGAATETPTAQTAQMRGLSAAAAMESRTCLTAGQTAPPASFAVPMGSVCGWHGNVTEIQTARTSLMSLTAVSFLLCLFKTLCLLPLISYLYLLVQCLFSVFFLLHGLCFIKAISLFII